MGNPVPVHAPDPDPAWEPCPPVDGYGMGATANMPSHLPYGYTHEQSGTHKECSLADD